MTKRFKIEDDAPFDYVVYEDAKASDFRIGRMKSLTLPEVAVQTRSTHVQRFLSEAMSRGTTLEFGDDTESLSVQVSNAAIGSDGASSFTLKILTFNFHPKPKAKRARGK